MLPVYLAALVFGLVLIGASILVSDADHSHALGSHGSPHAHDASWLPFLSPRFWSYTLGAFGMSGAALTLLAVPAGIHVPVSAALGLFVGSATTWLFRRLQREATGTGPAAEELLGAEGEVVLALREERLGKIRVRLEDHDVEILARARPTDDLAAKSRVVVVRMKDGVAEVLPAPWDD
ncbi:MAG TPA: NfeD family protein [Thermoanaerobaculia bacterium]|nr:NfeD family protein [Thermoanaerobaculia bacterium]